ncbi:MAG: phosphoribosylformylglycinamidine synthase subunit PurQ [Candidatus Methylacidiphilales bacterium]
MKFAVIQFPGSNCDQDCLRAIRDVVGQPVRMVWHKESEILPDETIIVPGGFSYGDYLRCGAIARFSPVMEAVKKAASEGQAVIGICNGFQILCEAGLLPGALVRNRDLHFICNTVTVRVENSRTRWTSMTRDGDLLRIPIAHGEGNYRVDEETLHAMEAHGQILFRYVDEAGNPTERSNPNGSLSNIAGICNRAGNVFGMMPHPERAAESLLGSEDGLKLFHSLISS